MLIKILKTIKLALVEFLSYGVFITLLFLFVIKKTFESMMRIRFIGPVFKRIGFGYLSNQIGKLLRSMDRKADLGVSRTYMIELAIKNLRAKKVRTAVTIGGVAVGVGAIVFLVSLGYGLEKMVIGKVARLEELKTLDVGLGEVSSLKMNDEFIKKVEGIPGVEEVVPVVGMVSKVRFKNSISDIMAFGVDKRYIKAVGAKLVSGSEFKESSLTFKYGGGEVAGDSVEIVKAVSGQKVDGGLVKFNVAGDSRLEVYDKCSVDGENLGYLIRLEGGLVGERVFGGAYHLGQQGKVVIIDELTGEELANWIRVKTPLWQVDADGLTTPMMSDDGGQKWVVGCIRDYRITEDEEMEELVGYKTLEEYLYNDTDVFSGAVLGEATVSAQVASDSSESASLFDMVVTTDESGTEWVELRNVGESEKKAEDLSFTQQPSGEAYVSSGLVKMFGMNNESILGQRFGVSYIVPDGLIPGASGRLQSQETDYRVVGVIDDDSSNYYYFQIDDARKLGVRNYSQVKVLTSDQGQVMGIRKTIESSGFRTMSTLDTVAQIEQLFGTLRLLLGFLGTIALAVASLGMFNTMTVSLLERTREVGVMKAMGMQITEVRELFLAESMIMGVGGGAMGVILGYLGGRLLSLILTSISIVKGQGVLDISYVPLFFVVFILAISFVVGVLTGWYPSKRATKISALNALRYE